MIERDLQADLLDDNLRLRARIEELEGRVSELEGELADPESRTIFEFYDNAPDMFFNTDVKTGRVLQCNNAVEAVLGYRKTEVIGQSIRDLIHPDGLERAHKTFRRYSIDGELDNVELLFRRKDGRAVVTRLSATAVRDRNGTILYSRSVARDMTDLKQVELALEDANRELRRVMSSVPDYLWSAEIDRQGVFKYRYYSPVVQQITGRPPEFYMPGPHRWLSTVHPDDRARLSRSQDRLLEPNATSIVEEHRILLPNHEVRWVRNAVVVDRSNPDRTLVNGVVSDITKKKEAEEDFARRRAELAHASRLNVLGEMVAGIAHEINQPLASMANFAGAGLNYLGRLQSDDHHQLEEWLRKISSQAERTGKIIHRLKRFSRKDEVEATQFDVAELIQETLELLAMDSQHWNVEVEVDLEPLPKLHADRVQIQQVLVNLLRNGYDAMSAMPEEERFLRVEARQIASRVAILVRDRGSGIALEDCDKVFDAFYTTKVEGMGIGLAISRAIVEAHGGALKAQPNEHRGATFELTLPLGGHHGS